MTETKQTSDRAKLVMIPILGLVLLFVLMDDGKQEAAATPIAPAKTPVTENSFPKQSLKYQPIATQINWPRKSLTTICAHNPFELRDPRAMIDKAFLEAGITYGLKMKEISVDEFFPEPEVPSEDDKSSGQQLSKNTSVAVLTVKTEDEQRSPQTSPNNPMATQMPHESSISEPEQLTEERAEAGRRMRLQQRLLSLENEPVRMFMKSRSGTSALLGGRRVSEGELIEDGIRIAAIDRTGITLEIVDTEPTEQDMLPVSEQ